LSEPVRLSFDSHHVLREVSGDLDANLRWVADQLDDTTIRTSNGTLIFESTSGDHVIASRLFHQLAQLAEAGRGIHPTDVRDGLRSLQQDPESDLLAFFRDVVVLDRKRRPITARTPNQHAYVRALRDHDVVFGLGPAGTGKTYLAVCMAVAAHQKGQCKKIIITRPAVEAGERLGFLPGDLNEKVDPYLRPIFDALHDIYDGATVARMMEEGTIEVAPLAYMRGRTLNQAYVILDEAQNTTVEQMKMFLTRLGDRGRMVITGDASQVDLLPPKRSGLAHAVGLLSRVRGIAVVEMAALDVVRHPLVAKIIAAYERETQRGRGGGPRRRGAAPV